MLISFLYFIKSEFNTTVTMVMALSYKYRDIYGEATFAANKMIESHDTLLIIILMLVSNGQYVG